MTGCQLTYHILHNTIVRCNNNKEQYYALAFFGLTFFALQYIPLQVIHTMKYMHVRTTITNAGSIRNIIRTVTDILMGGGIEREQGRA